MEISLSRSSVSYARNVYSCDLTQEESAEAIVPDAMADILRIADVDGTAFIRSKEAENGRVTVSGIISATVLYVPDGEEGIRRFGCEMPFSLSGQAEEINTQTRVTAGIRISAIESALLNSRKVMIKAELAASVRCYLDVGEVLASEAEEAEDAKLLVLPAVSTVTAAVAVREKTFVLSDELTLSPGNPPVGELLRVRSELVAGDAKPVGSKAVLRGVCRTSLLYRAAGSGEVCSDSFENEYSQIVEMDTELENAELQVIPMLTSAYYDNDMMSGGQEGRTIVTEIHAVVQCVAFARLDLAYIQDAYSTQYLLELRRKKLTMRSRTGTYELGGVFLGTVEASPRPVRVIRAAVTSGPVSIRSEGEKRKLSSRLTARIIYQADDGGLYAASHGIDASVLCDGSDGELLEAQAVCSGELYAMASAGVIELRIPAEFSVAAFETVELSAVDAIAADEDQPVDLSSSPTIIVHTAAPGETLRSLARKYSSTPAVILETNSLEPGESIGGKRLLILPQKR